MLDDFIVHGKGDARSALRALYSWKDVTSQTLVLVEWMHEYSAEEGTLASMSCSEVEAPLADISRHGWAGRLG